MFKKFDGKKNRLELIEPEFIEGLGRVLSFGAEKYAKNNWMLADSKDDQDRIYGALQRHLMAYRKGEKIDPETRESHLYHACCNLMFLDYQDRMKLINKENYAINKWLEHSIFTMRRNAYLEIEISEVGSTRTVTYGSYDDFFHWLTTEQADLYAMNGVHNDD